jgi:hypothetical protein
MSGMDLKRLARPAGLEPATSWFVAGKRTVSQGLPLGAAVCRIASFDRENRPILELRLVPALAAPCWRLLLRKGKKRATLCERYLPSESHRYVTGIQREAAPENSTLNCGAQLRRRVTEGTLGAARLPEILKRVSADRAYWTLVGVGAEVLAAAEKLVAVHRLRTLDAIHVASAQVFAAGVSDSDLMFVSAHKRQTEAAVVVGLATRYIA